MMKSTAFAILAVALLAGINALPVAEDKWSDQDEMLARVFSDSTPVSMMIQESGNDETIAHAQGQAETNHADASDAAATEDEATAQETAATESAAGLAAEENHLAEEAAMAAYEKTMADLAASGEAADAATEKRLADEKSTADKTASDLADAEAAGEKAAHDLEASEAHLQAQKAKIAGDYATAMDGINKKAEADDKAIADEAADWKAKYEANVTGNNNAASEMEAKLEAEKKQNAADAKAAHDDIEAKYAGIDAAHQAAEDAFHAKQDADAKALAASRAETQAEFAKTAADAQAEYAHQMAVADEMQADADAAKAEYDEDMAAGEREQEEHDALTKAALESGNEIKGCTTEQCLNTDGECVNLKDEDGTQHYWQDSTDLTSCTTTPGGQYGAAYGAGVARAGVGPSLTLAPIEPPSADCHAQFDHLGDFADSTQKIIHDYFANMDHEQLPVKALACDDSLSEDQVRHLMEWIFDTGSKCPMYCEPGTETTVPKGCNPDASEGDDDYAPACAIVSHGDCLLPEAFGHFRDEIHDMPEYQDTGTVQTDTGTGRFAADNQWNKRMCSEATHFMDGFNSGRADLK